MTANFRVPVLEETSYKFEACHARGLVLLRDPAGSGRCGGGQIAWATSSIILFIVRT